MASRYCLHLVVVHYGGSYGNKAWKDENVGNLSSGHQYTPMMEHVTYVVAIDTCNGQQQHLDTDKCHALLMAEFGYVCHVYR